MTDLVMLSLAEIGERIRRKEVSPVEVTRAYLDRITAYNGKVNAFVTITADEALAAARQAETEVQRGQYRGHLHGVPIGHKDLYYTRGVRTTAGSRVRETFVPEEDATVVARYRAAGAVMLGKLNTHEFAYGPTNEHSMFGPSRNPWDLERITGGSSGGSGAAIALSLCAGSTGSDTGGSIRMPAACCGIVGLKPTYGRTSRHGIFPLCWTMDHPGPMTHTVQDAALMLQPIAGHDARDPATTRRPVPDYAAALTGDVRGLRVGVPTRYFYDRADPVVEQGVRGAVRTLADLGAEVREVDIAHIEHAAAAALTIYLAEATAYHEDTLATRPDLYTAQVRGFLELGNYVLAKDYLHAQRYRQLLGRSIAAVFRQVDMLVTPTLPIMATRLWQQTITVRGEEETVFAALLRNTEPFNLTGLPALAVPCGFSPERLPISMQVVGRPFEEATVLRAGHAYQQATDWHRQRPSL
jgi:aspartyl-tRNA(Asn)/glutamyl-tRNA(Gln) amidotransferase subunit A